MIIKKILAGSRYFFDQIEGFNPGDTDYILIVDDLNVFKKHIHKNYTCYFLYRLSTIKNTVSYLIAKNSPLGCTSLLYPEFANYIGLTIEKLSDNNLYNLFKQLPFKHQYLNFIYNSYIENNGFYLTDEQRMYAYNLYCDARK
jgi:hypothetical protein